MQLFGMVLRKKSNTRILLAASWSVIVERFSGERSVFLFVSTPSSIKTSVIDQFPHARILLYLNPHRYHEFLTFSSTLTLLLRRVEDKMCRHTCAQAYFEEFLSLAIDYRFVCSTVDVEVADME